MSTVMPIRLHRGATLTATFAALALLLAFVLPGWGMTRPARDAAPLIASLAADAAGATPLFGMDTEPVADGDLPIKWRRVEVSLTRDFQAMAECHANAPCSAAARRLLDLSAEGAGRSGRARVGLINRAVDLAIAPASDETQWGVPDRWSDPLETLQSGRGDCEDYAIVKYVALLQAGFARNDVKIVVLKNLFPNEDHAAVAVRVEGQWLILDNRTLTLVQDTDVVRTIPLFVLDQSGVRRFVWVSRNRRTAG
jgi:predicted transglutaminase-like cysteine proteinase